VAVLAASRFEEVNRLVVQALHSPRCRVYPTLALKDVELGGALVQVLGACLGVARGLKLGAAICAVLIARGDVEAVRLARKTAGDPVIFSGLAGVGELVASLLVPDHPAIVRGERLAAGERDEELAKLARVLLGIEPDLPLTQGIGALAAGKVTAQALLAQLMERGVRVEGR
jgi:glycerol-3-phosphate dehydrogenase (NAD(P)+)